MTLIVMSSTPQGSSKRQGRCLSSMWSSWANRRQTYQDFKDHNKTKCTFPVPSVMAQSPLQTQQLLN